MSDTNCLFMDLMVCYADSVYLNTPGYTIVKKANKNIERK